MWLIEDRARPQCKIIRKFQFVGHSPYSLWLSTRHELVYYTLFNYCANGPRGCFRNWAFVL